MTKFPLAADIGYLLDPGKQAIKKEQKRGVFCNFFAFLNIKAASCEAAILGCTKMEVQK